MKNYDNKNLALFFGLGFVFMTVVLLFSISLLSGEDTTEAQVKNPGQSNTNTSNDPLAVPNAPDLTQVTGSDDTSKNNASPGSDKDSSEWADSFKMDELVNVYGADPDSLPKTFPASKLVPITTNQGDYVCGFKGVGAICVDKQGDPWVYNNSFPLLYGGAGVGQRDDFSDDRDQR